MEDITVVVGASGNIGSAIALKESSNRNVLCIDKRYNEDFSDIAGICQVVGDCLDIETLTAQIEQKICPTTHRVKSLVLAAALDSVPKDGETQDGYNRGIQNQRVEDIRKRIDVNITSQLLMIKAFHRYLYNESSVLLFSSIYGVVSPDHRIYEKGFIKPIEYSCSKSAMIGVCKHLAVSLALEGKGRCNCLVLGGIESEAQSEDFKVNYTDKVPLKRMGTLEDVTSCYGFISGSDASYITGATIVIDGGYTAW